MDGKGRVSLPAAYRGILADGGGDLGGSYQFTLVYSDRGHACVEGYTMESIDKIYDQIEELPEYSEEREYLENLLGSEAFEITVEGSGRFVLPEEARKQIGMTEGELSFVGRLNRFQIWEKSAYQAHKAELKARNSDFASPDHPLKSFAGRAKSKEGSE